MFQTQDRTRNSTVNMEAALEISITLYALQILLFICKAGTVVRRDIKSSSAHTSRHPSSLIARRTTSELPLACEVSTDGTRIAFLLLPLSLLFFTSIRVSSDTSLRNFLQSFLPLSECIMVALATPPLSLSCSPFLSVIGAITRGTLRARSGCICLMDTVLSVSGSSDFILSKTGNCSWR